MLPGMLGHAAAGRGRGTERVVRLAWWAALLSTAWLTACSAPRSAEPITGWRGRALGVSCKVHLQDWRAADFDGIAALGANAIAYTPFGSMPDPGASEVRRSRILAEHREVLRAARAAGLFVLLKPHLWIDRSWAGAVEMRSESDWPAFFAGYRAFLLDWVEIARDEGVDAVCIGTELDRTLVFESEWRALIRDVRVAYSGKLLYAAHWSEYARVPFWDALDAIGINAYFPLAVGPRPSFVELERAWRPIRLELAGFAARADRPIVFTELGYRPLADVFARPWEPFGGGEPAPENQANGLDAALAAFLEEPWFGGIFVWEWLSARFLARGGQGRSPYSPQGTPAAARLAERFASARGRVSP
jgi:hypothetical protein